MALPQTVRVKLSSEVAEAISITPVVLQELPVRELVEHLLGIAGKDEPRIREMLRRGTLVSGATRFRWAGWDADVAKASANCWRLFPTPIPPGPLPPPVASAPRCAEAATPSRSRARPRRASLCFSGRLSGTC